MKASCLSLKPDQVSVNLSQWSSYINQDVDYIKSAIAHFQNKTV